MKDDKIYLRHIRDAIQKIETYSSGGKVSFFQNSQVQDAVIRNLEIIGEAIIMIFPGAKLQECEMK